MTQPTLFDAPSTRGASRKSDPATSRDAGRSMTGMVLRDQQALVLEAVAARGEANPHEVQTWLRAHERPCPERNAIGSRFRELTEMGMVRPEGTRPGPSGRGEQVVAVTDKGREWVAGRTE